MNSKLSREGIFILLLAVAFFFSNPSLWWLAAILLFIVINNSRPGDNQENSEQREQREQHKRRERREESPKRRQRQNRHDDNPFREIGEEIRRQWEQNVVGPNRNNTSYSNPTISERTQPRPPSRPAPPAKRDSSAPLSHAVEAVEAAGHMPEDLALLPVDIGFIAYSDGERPVRHREAPIPNTVNFIQPYIELRLQRPAAGTLRFEVLDSAGEVHYSREERRQLKAGRTPVIPGTRMPVGDFLYTDSDWTLRVYAAGTLIAEHCFAWTDPGSSPFLREHLAEDGELSADLAELVEDARLQPMSLDDLLSDQPAQTNRRRN